MGKKNLSIQDECNAFIEHFGFKEVYGLVREIDEFYRLFDVEPGDDWVQEEIKEDEENTRIVRCVRSCYLLSRIAVLYSGKMLLIKTKFPDFYTRLIKHVKDNKLEG